MKKILYTAARKVFIVLIFKGKVLKDSQTVRGFFSLNEAMGTFLHSIELSEFYYNLFEIPM